MRYSRFTAVMATTAITLAACGGGSDTTDTSAGTTVADSTADTAPETTTPETMAETTAPAETMAETTAPADAAGDTIVAVAAGNPDFSTLVAAVQAAGLEDTLNGAGPFTVFAPTNEAFDKALTDLGMTADELLADKELLTQVLTYHVVAGEVPSADVAGLNGQEVPTVNGASVKITVDGDKVMVNDANVTAVDIEASNGVIHVIDKVLIPPTDGSSTDEGATGDSTDDSAASETDNLMEVANKTSDLSTFVQATGAADLFGTLAVDGPFTIFAPTNEAFEQALSDLDMTAEELFADKELLTKVLSYHVVSGTVPAADVVTLDGQDVDTIEGSPVKITIDGDKVMVNDATVTTADLMASNGVIHVIDKVLLPPSN